MILRKREKERKRKREREREREREVRRRREEQCWQIPRSWQSCYAGLGQATWSRGLE